MARDIITGKRAKSYDDLNVKFAERFNLLNNFVVKHVAKNTKVCDLATGTGADIEILKDKVKEIVGVDLSKDMLEICKKKFSSKKVKLKYASATETGLKDSYFDYVILRLGFHHIKDKKAVVDEAHRILKPNGKFIVIDKFYLNLFEYFWKAMKKLFFELRLDIFEHMVSKQKNIDLLTSKFKITTEIYLPYEKNHTGQIFMFVLEKKK